MPCLTCGANLLWEFAFTDDSVIARFLCTNCNEAGSRTMIYDHSKYLKKQEEQLKKQRMEAKRNG
jgi:radical SAM superfamily enzyme